MGVEIFNSIDLKDVKGVLLDLDNTLYAYEPCHDFALISCFNFIKEENQISFKVFTELYNISKERVKTELVGLGASHSRLLYFQKFVELLKGKTDVALILELETLYWKSFFSNMELFPEALTFLKNCKKSHIPIAIITDLTLKIQAQKIIHLRIQPYIKWIISSEEAGVEKPHPYIFHLGLEKLGLMKSDVIMIGDNTKKDILGADILNIKNYLI